MSVYRIEDILSSRRSSGREVKAKNKHEKKEPSPVSEVKNVWNPSDDTFRTFIDASSDLFISLSPLGVILWANARAFEKITGWKTSQWIGRPFMPLVHPDDLSAAVAAFSKLVDKGSLQPLEIRLRTKGGDYVFLEFTGSSNSSSDDMKDILCVGRNVTAQRVSELALRNYVSEHEFQGKLLEKAYSDLNLRNTSLRRELKERVRVEKLLRDSEARYRWLAESLKKSEESFKVAEEGADVGIWDWDILNQKVHYSERYKLMMGFDQNEFKDQLTEWSRRIHPEDRTRVWKSLRETLSGMVPRFETEYRLKIKNGEFRWFHSRGVVFRGASGEAVRMAGAQWDISDRKKIEEELRASEVLLQAQARDLARSNRELEQFAYLVSHDLKEPLRMVTSYLRLIEKRYQGQIDKDANEFINYAVDGAKRMYHLLDDLLRYSRVNPQDNRVEFIDSSSVLALAIKNLEVGIRESNAKISYEQLPMVYADPTQLVQIFQNLIANAIKFRRGNSPHLRILAKQAEGEWIFSVEDNGIGIAPEYLERIFVIFQRLHRDAYPGTGIGLAICKKIVELHAGRIWAESRPGEGSVFFFTLPAIRASLEHG
jgi:PAS domain S-box-containing protein